MDEIALVPLPLIKNNKVMNGDEDMGQIGRTNLVKGAMCTTLTSRGNVGFDHSFKDTTVNNLKARMASFFLKFNPWLTENYSQQGLA